MPKKINPYREMSLPQDEIESTLPYEEVSQVLQPSQQQATKKDYLDDFTPVQNTNRNFSQPLMFNDEKDDNLIRNLLRVDWERVEHIIRGHKPKVDAEGNEYFVKIEEHYLNENGVNSVLHFLSFYLSKEIFLARYSADEVHLVMKNFAKQFTDFFFDSLEEFGLNTPQKKKMSKMFVHAVIDLVDASYSKAIEGKTAELIFKQFQVLQQQPLESYHNNPMMNSPRPKAGVMQRIFG